MVVALLQVTYFQLNWVLIIKILVSFDMANLCYLIEWPFSLFLVRVLKLH